MNEEQPTTPVGRRFIERHGTGKQREIIAIEREAAEQAVAPWREALHTLVEAVLEEPFEDPDRDSAQLARKALRRLLEGAEAREPGGSVTAGDPRIRELADRIDRRAANATRDDTPVLYADEAHAVVAALRGAAPREEGRTPPIDPPARDALRDKAIAFGVHDAADIVRAMGHDEIADALRDEALRRYAALRETPEGAQGQ